uniref:Uncharacterized protein n=1 Tax=Anguilla anguilla TaxID=7936 RepID=A0A0E9PT87_ANGAN
MGRKAGGWSFGPGHMQF